MNQLIGVMRKEQATYAKSVGACDHNARVLSSTSSEEKGKFTFSGNTSAAGMEANDPVSVPKVKLLWGIFLCSANTCSGEENALGFAGAGDEVAGWSTGKGA